MDGIFLPNKYTACYKAIIFKAQYRTISGYTENHHIIPKSLNGSNESDNLVRLTAREHFICHWLLTKMVTGKFKHKMLTAVYRMLTQKNTFQTDRLMSKSKKYEKIRANWAASHSRWLKGRYAGEKNPNFGNRWTDEMKDHLSKVKTGIPLGPFSDEHRRKMSEFQKGRPKSEQHKINVKKSWVATYDSRVGENHPMYGRTHSEESKQKMKESSAKRWTPEAREALSQKKKYLNSLKKLENKCQD